MEITQLDNTDFKRRVLEFINTKYSKDKIANFNDINWNDIVPNMLRDYLLSGLQAFFINDSNRHSIESNAMMTNRDLYDKFIGKFNSRPGETQEDSLLKLSNLMPYDNSTDENFHAQIISQALEPTKYTMDDTYDGSCQTYKITYYNVTDRLWLKLIWAIRHLGASCSIFDITKPIVAPSDNELIFKLDEIKDINSDVMNTRLDKLKNFFSRKNTNRATISYSNVLLLAATTSKRKVQSVKITLEAAQIIARFTGEGCEEGSGSRGSRTGNYATRHQKSNLSGGNYEDFNYLFKRSYRSYINSLNKIHKKEIKN